MFNRLREMLTRKELDDDKKNVEFEKNDLLALAIAAGSFMFPALLMIFMLIALIVLIVF